MMDQSIMRNSFPFSVVPDNPHENALQSLCKQLLKSRLFRGFYVERRYVGEVKGYRDIVSLQKSEKSLNKMLRDIRDKLQLFYIHQHTQMWIGITSGPLTGINVQPGAMDTFLWVEMSDLAFGQYWFSIKNINFRDNEIILKLKEIQNVEEEEVPKLFKALGEGSSKQICYKSTDSQESTSNSLIAKETSALDNQITLDDFLLVFQQWWATIKQTTYYFISQDISKENIIAVLRFLGLLVMSILLFTIMCIKSLGFFTLRFVFELCRLIYFLTPIILKIIDLFNKIIGGFYILLAMIWKDAIVNRNQTKNNALEYNRPIYKSIQYNIRQRQPSSFTLPNSGTRFK